MGTKGIGGVVTKVVEGIVDDAIVAGSADGAGIKLGLLVMIVEAVDGCG